MMGRSLSAARLAGLLNLPLLACATGPEGVVRVEQVRIAGNKAIGSDQITAGLATHGPTGLIFKDYAEYDEVVVARDRDRVEALYQSEGYYSARVTHTDVQKRADNEVGVTFTVEEGEPTRLETLDIEGMPERPADSKRDVPLDKLILLKKGEVLKESDYLATRDNLKGWLVRAGYAHASVKGAVEVDRDQRTAVVKLQVDPGPLVQFGDSKVIGLKTLPESAIRNRIDWSPGERYDPREVERTKGHLYELGFLSNVAIDPPSMTGDRPEIGDMTIHVREGLPHELTLGGGVALDNATFLVRPRFGYVLKGLWDPLLTLSFDARPGFVVYGTGNSGGLAGTITTTFTREDTLLPRLKATASVVLEVIELETYAARGLGAQIGGERPLFDDHVHVGADYQLRLLQITDVASELSLADRTNVGLPLSRLGDGLEINYRIGALDQHISLDLRDNPLDSRNGFYAELRTEEAGMATGSDFTYFKVMPEVRGYFAPWSFLGFAARVRYGISGGSRLPISQRFFSGGANDHRGFTYRRLAPMSENFDQNLHRVPIGGDAMLETSFETRIDLFRLFGNWVGLVPFLDGGDVTDLPTHPDVTNLHWAAGLGLRYKTLVGPIRFDVGYRLNRYGAGEPDPGARVAFHLSMGQAF
jgi:translocation and assembly module TamA